MKRERQSLSFFLGVNFLCTNDELEAKTEVLPCFVVLITFTENVVQC